MAHWVFACAVLTLLIAYLGNDKTVLHFRYSDERSVAAQYWLMSL